MPLPVTVPVAIAAIKALVRFRDRVDTILSLNEASTGLPFMLPPPPAADAPFKDMRAFFKSDQGQAVLQLREQQSDLETVLRNPTSSLPADSAARSRLSRLYYEASGGRAVVIGPDERQAKVLASRGPSTEMRLAYYVVESQRLSRNTALTRVLLATADTLLEFAGQNAGLFISHPQTRSIVEGLIEEFAGKRDFDDDGIELIFKSLLGSTISALANHLGDLQNKPALQALFAALGEVRESLGNDFVARIVSLEGFEQLVAAYATEVAGDPSFFTQSALARQVLTATLTRVGQHFEQILTDPKALLGVLQVGLGAAAGNVAGILERQLGGDPVLPAVLSVVLREVETLGKSNELFGNIAQGDVIAGIYRAALQAVAANPVQFAGQSDVEKFVSDLMAGLAEAISQEDLTRIFTLEAIEKLASESLSVLTADPQFIAGNSQFATELLAAVFKAGAAALSDGLTVEELIDFAATSMKTVAENSALLNLNDRLSAVMMSVGDAVAANDGGRSLSLQGRKALLLAALRAVAANPAVWGRLQEKNLVLPLLEGVLQALVTDPTRLLSGPVLAAAFGRVLLAAMRRGQQFMNNAVDANELKELITAAVNRAGEEIGKTIDGVNVPVFLERSVLAFLKAPFKLIAGSATALDQLFEKILIHMESVD